LHLSWSGATHLPVDGDRGTQNVLTDSVAGPFIVECLFDINLVGQSEDPVLFHAGD
jgi:hypothetical protein